MRERGLTEVGAPDTAPGMLRYRRVEGGDRFSHQTVAVLEVFATAVVALHSAIEDATDPFSLDATWWEGRAYEWARGAVRAARLLTVKDGYR